MDTGERYESVEDFNKKIGNVMQEQDPDIIFYVHYSGGAPLYVYSNRLSGEIIRAYLNG